MSAPSSISSYYPYEPSKVLPIIFAILVAGIGIAILYQSLRTKWTHFGWMMAWASAIWTSGFILREISTYRQDNLHIFIVQYVLVFVGPPIFAAAEMFILGRLLAYLPYHTTIHPGRVLTTFLILNISLESPAAIGAAKVADPGNTVSEMETGLACIKASLIMQEIVELLFFSLVAMLEYRCRRAGHFPRNVRIVCRVLYVTSFMMNVRCIVRTIQMFQSTMCAAPSCGAIENHEWYLWVFEVANITVFVALLAIYHPGRYLPADIKQYLDPVDGVTERIGPGYSAIRNRSTLFSTLDPFNIASRLRPKQASRKHERFWEMENPIAEKCFAGGGGTKPALDKEAQAEVRVVHINGLSL